MFCYICSSRSLTVSFTNPFLLCNVIKILVFASKLYSVSFFPPIIFSFPLHGVFPSHQVVQISSICNPPYESLSQNSYYLSTPNPNVQVPKAFMIWRAGSSSPSSHEKWWWQIKILSPVAKPPHLWEHLIGTIIDSIPAFEKTGRQAMCSLRRQSFR